MTEESMGVYALPGTKEWVRCHHWNRPEGFVKMNDLPPNGGVCPHVAEASGDWILPTETYDAAAAEFVAIQRQQEYLKSASVTDQLEALTEAAMGRPEKLNALVAKIQEIKTQYPK